MKNILLLTNIYPNNDPNYGGTPVCHFFTKEWKEMGYNVRVIHFDSLFPRAFYLIGRLFNNLIQAKTGCVAYTNVPRKPKKYHVDNIPVLFVPLRKLIPHKNFSDKQITKAFDYVCSELAQDNFVPDAITGHFTNPQLRFLHLFKQKYSSVKTCMVLHSAGENMPSVYGEQYKEYMKSVDVWGFRSVAFKNKFEKLFRKQNNEFLCYSGIPSKYLEPIERNFENGICHFSFLGSLYKLKRVEDTIQALHRAFPKGGYTFDIIGSGAEEDNLRRLVSKLGLQKQVVFHGQQKRDFAQEIVQKSDCFVMVSSHEAFGLVYVEAMAKGCIVIATKGQGIDGIIVNGENGFLCEAENPSALSALIKEICSLPNERLKCISANAIKTAKNLTNRRVAENYINMLQ